MAGRVSRDKGQRGELLLRDLFRAAGYEAERGGQQSSGTHGVEQDVRHTIPGIWAECKRVEAFSCLTRAIEQAKKDSASTGMVPTVWSKTSRDEWLVTMPASAFFNFLLKGISE
jgi:hypothetical protein